MTHRHLTFDLSCRFKNDTDNDYDRASAECERAHLAAGRQVGDKRNDSYKAEHDSADQSDTVRDLSDVVRSRSAGTDTRYGTAVVLQVVGYFSGIERDRHVEICERDDENERE